MYTFEERNMYSFLLSTFLYSISFESKKERQKVLLRFSWVVTPYFSFLNHLGTFLWDLLPSRLSIPGAQREVVVVPQPELCVCIHTSVNNRVAIKLALYFHLHTYTKRRAKERSTFSLFPSRKKLLYPSSYLFCLFWYSGMEKEKSQIWQGFH